MATKRSSSGKSTSSDISPSSSNLRFATGLLRAFGGAILFCFPMLMTMEMWWLGFYMDPLRLALFTCLAVPLLITLSYYAGFEETHRRIGDVLDGFCAYAVGCVTATALLLLLGIIGPGMSASEIIGKIALQAVPASIGAMLERGELGESERADEKRRTARYGGTLFLMAVGALYLCSSLAPTEEMVLISYMMSPWHVVALMLVSLVLVHGFVYAMVARGKSPLPRDPIPFASVFLRFSVVGYAIALLVSLYMLWSFGRTDDMTPGQILQATVVLGFPAAIGAGIAQLIF